MPLHQPIHLLLDMHPNIISGKFINNLKTVASSLIRKQFSEHFKDCYWKPVLWTRVYCLITEREVALSILAEYITETGKAGVMTALYGLFAIHLHPNGKATQCRYGWRIPQCSLKKTTPRLYNRGSRVEEKP
uniref:transposase n=1 Tax=Endozoicomonas sp. Mp262 TaxID=2919499 RepID=UPI00351ACAF5